MFIARRAIPLALLSAVCVLLLSAHGLGPAALRAAAAAPAQQGPPEVGPAEHQDLSPPLSSLAPLHEGHGWREQPLRTVPPAGAQSTQPDSVVQSSANGTQLATIAGLDFAGVGYGDYGFTPAVA